MNRLDAMPVILCLVLIASPLRAADAAGVPRLIEKPIKHKEATNRHAAAMHLGYLGPKAMAAVPVISWREVS